jgi:iron complex outermembrane recepter protein
MSKSRLNAVWRATPVIAPMLVAAAGLAGAGPAHAQDAAAGATEETSSPDEIIVTAQRREESLRDVPISIVAIGNEELQNRNVTDVSRLEQVAPGLQLGRSGTDARPAIRGIHTEQIQGNSDPRVGFYIDEIYQSRTSQLSVPFVDLARVEVQKGPQGTLYGRNSFGGNIALVTNQPSDRFEGGVDLIYGAYDRTLASAYINLPISNGLAARFAGAIEQRGPYIESVTNPAASYDDLGQQYIRGALRWAPPGMDNGLEIILRGSYWHQDDAGANTFNSKAIGQLVDESLIVPPGGTVNIGGATFTFPLGFNGRSFATGKFVPYNAFRDGFPDIKGADVGVLIPGPYKALNNEPNFNRVNSVQLSATIGMDVTDWLAFRSITGYVDFKAVRGGDNDGTQAPFGVAYFITENKAFSQELQLLSNDSTSPLQYTVGVYYLHDRVPDGFLSARPDRTYSTANALATGQLPLYFGSNFTFLPNGTIGAPGSDAWNPLSYLDTKSYAGYGQLSYTFAEKLTVTGGIRYTVDDKNFFSALGNAFAPAGTYLVFQPDLDFNRTCSGLTPADPSSTAPASVVANALITRCGQKTFKFFTYRAAVDYKPNDDTLLYASYSTGKRSGGFSYSVIPGTPNNTLPFVDAESVEAWEAGVKTSFFDRRVQVNLAAFYNKYSNLQVQRSFPNPLTPNSLITVGGNGGTGDAPGVDLEIIARPLEGLRLNLAANYLRARVDPFPAPTFDNGICAIAAPGGTCTTRPEVRFGFGGGITPNPVSNPELFVPVLGPDGRQIVNAAGIPLFETLGTGRRDQVQNQSDFTMRAGIAYEIDLGGNGTLTPEAQTYYNDGYLLAPVLVNFRQESYTKTDLYLTWRDEDDRLSVQGFVQNLENKAVLGRVTTGSGGAFSGTYQPPRTWGIRASYRY